MARDPLRTYRAADDVYDPAVRAAAQRGESVSAVLRRALVDYAKPRPTASRNPGRRADDAASSTRRR